MVNPVSVPQDTESVVRSFSNSRFTYRYAYARSAESRHYGDAGQDYLAFFSARKYFAFALCDGVSLSFHGGFGASFLGDALVNWLSSFRSATIEAEPLQTVLTSFLCELVVPASDKIALLPLPGDASPILREVLEEKRVLGSETTFICGRLDFPSPALPEGRVMLAWLGDSRLRLWGPEGERTKVLGDTFKTSQRWSTKIGPVESSPHVYISPLVGDKGVCRLVAYTDGLSLLDDLSIPPPDTELQDLIDLAGSSSTSDDIALLEIRPNAVLSKGEPCCEAMIQSQDLSEQETIPLQVVQVPEPDLGEARKGRKSKKRKIVFTWLRNFLGPR